MLIEAQSSCQRKLCHRHGIHSPRIEKSDSSFSYLVKRYSVKSCRGKLNKFQFLKFRNVVIKEKSVANHGVRFGEITFGHTSFVLLKHNFKSERGQHIKLFCGGTECARNKQLHIFPLFLTVNYIDNHLSTLNGFFSVFLKLLLSPGFKNFFVFPDIVNSAFKLFAYRSNIGLF